MLLGVMGDGGVRHLAAAFGNLASPDPLFWLAD
jgi:hypothetical protein